MTGLLWFRTRLALLSGLMLAVAAGCSEQNEVVMLGGPNGTADTDTAQAADPERPPTGPEWISLIGSDLNGWRKRQDRPMSWKVENGVLINALAEGQHGVDIISDRRFDDFEIYYQYRLPPGSNSGMYLRGRYEIQILEDAGHDPGKGSNGAIYGVAAPAVNASRPAGEWQTVRAKIVDNRITVILNGQKVIDNVEVPGPTGGALDDKVNEPGPIMIQGDHGPVEVRYLMVRPLGS